MNLKNLFFHIDYCNSRKNEDFSGKPKEITRVLQHHKILLITEGCGSFIIGDEVYPIKKGMLFYIAPNVLQTIKLNNDKPISFFSVHFNFTNVFFEVNKWTTSNIVKNLPLQNAQELSDYYAIQDCFKRLTQCWSEKQPGYEFISRTLLQQLLIAIYQNITKQDKNYANSLKVNKIIKHMQKNLSNKITLTELAKIANLSPTYLAKIFKETTDYSVIEFFNKLKIDKAKDLLIENNKKIKEVANTVGFSDEFYFSRIFKQIEGISPSEYYNKIIH